MVASKIRVPGVYFLPPKPAANAGLPQLDVAAFVGFAQRGPVDLPVAVEDQTTFEAVFGSDLALSQETREGGGTDYANLPKAVQTFFDQGGRRCYVVRVVGQAAATATLPLPGLQGLDPDGNVRTPTLQATSPGAWGNALRLNLRLVSKPLPPAAFSFNPGGITWTTGGAPDAIQPGDLLRFWCIDGTSRLIAVANVTPIWPIEATVTVERAWRELTMAPLSPPLLVDQVFLPGQITPLAIAGADLGSAGDKLTLTLSADEASSLKSGDALELDLSDGRSYLFGIESITQEQPAGSPPIDTVTLHSTTLIDKQSLAVDAPAPPFYRVDRLRFDMAVRLDIRTLIVEDLGFNRQHPSFWGDSCLQGSSLLRKSNSGNEAQQRREFTQTQQLAAQNAALFRKLQTGERIDPVRDGELDQVVLAGLVAAVTLPDGSFLPAGMTGFLDEDSFAKPLSLGADDLDLYDQHTAALFQDPYLSQFNQDSAAALAGDAFDRYYLQDQRLKGLHSLFFIDEAALIAAPDANHRNWVPGQSGATTTVVEDLPDQPEPPADLFALCLAPPSIETVQPSRASAAGGTIVDITGAGFVPGATTVTFGIQVSGDVNVIDATDLRCVVPAGSPGETTVTVSTEGGSSIPVSFVYTEPPTPAIIGALEGPELFSLETSPLLAIQAALIAFCEARADVAAILTLPQHFEKRQALEWRQKLAATSDLSYGAVYHPWLFLRDGDASKPALRLVPPDGAICGLIARREHDRQVWIAPANLPLNNVLGLSPQISDDDWADLFDAQVNLVRPEPRDFRPMSAHTLSDDASLLQLSVRRLMILLRKLLLQRGNEFVFESNHERFRTLTRIALEDTLRYMFNRGAFAGGTPSQSFRVVADASVNPPQSVDLGRFIVQLQVAPSQPMEFITVQLTRTGGGELLAAEV